MHFCFIGGGGGGGDEHFIGLYREAILTALWKSTLIKMHYKVTRHAMGISLVDFIVVD